MENTDRWVRVGHATGAAGFDAGFMAAGRALGTQGISGFHNQTLVVLAVS